MTLTSSFLILHKLVLSVYFVSAPKNFPADKSALIFLILGDH